MRQRYDLVYIFDEAIRPLDLPPPDLLCYHYRRWDRISHMGSQALNRIQYALLYALREGSLGRRTLVRQTAITEMTVRTHLEKLRALGLVAMAKGGTSLTPSGLEAFKSGLRRIAHVGPLPLAELALDHYNAAALVTQAKDALKESWRFRDLAVRAGATGALFLTRGPDYWHLSDDARPLNEKNPRDAQTIESRYAARPDDGLVIVFSADKTRASLGLWEILTTLIANESIERSRSR